MKRRCSMRDMSEEKCWLLLARSNTERCSMHCRRVQSRPLHGPRHMGSAAGIRLLLGSCLRMRPHRCGRMLP